MHKGCEKVPIAFGGMVRCDRVSLGTPRPISQETFSHPCARHSRATGYDAGKNVLHAPQGRVYVRHAVCDGVPYDKRRNVFTHPLRRRMPAHRASLLTRLRVCIRVIN